MSFRINARRIILTYHTCSLKKEILSLLQSKMEIKNKKITQYFLSSETSPSHVHVFLEFSSKIDTRDYEYFDLYSELEKKRLHGNYQVCNNVVHWCSYIFKEDKSPLHNFYEYFYEKLMLNKDNTISSSLNSNCESISKENTKKLEDKLENCI